MSIKVFSKVPVEIWQETPLADFVNGVGFVVLGRGQNHSKTLVLSASNNCQPVRTVT